MIGLHALALMLAFLSGGSITLSVESITPEDRRVFGWVGVACAIFAGVLFVMAEAL